MKILFAFFLSIILAASAYALSVDPPLPDATQEERARALFHELRCVVCQGETIADSPSEVARDMRMEVRQQIALDKNDAEIMDYFLHQYGEKVRMKPIVEGNELLWFSPLLLLLFGVWVVWHSLFKRRTS